MDKLITKLAGLGVRGLVLVVAGGAAEVTGGAALVVALTAIGPFGIFGGVLTLGLIALITDSVGEYGIKKVFSAVLEELIKQGYSVEEIIDTINNGKFYKFMSKSLKLELLDLLREYRTPSSN